jgi:hypothetical protein
MSRVQAACVCACLLVLCACSNQGNPARAQSPEAAALCSYDAAVGTAGQRKLALIVGIAAYRNDKIPDLEGPPNDARQVYELLTAANGFGVPAQNVCLLLDDEATVARFREAFQRALVDRAQSGDVAFVFFAGHGSQTKDKNGDEPDQFDETLVLADSRTDGVHDLADDELNGLLARLHQKTDNIVLVLDSCNSGTAMRGDSGLVARFFTPEETAGDGPAAADGAGDGDAGWGGAALPGLVAFTAASDGTPALESRGAGIFTSALVHVLAEAAGKPLTYAQIARQVAPLVAAKSYQIPYFQGDVQRAFLGGGMARRALGWDVVTAGDPLLLSGPPLPGLGVGAELRIFDGAVTGALAPSAAKATAVITSLNGINAEARVTGRTQGAAAIAAGDLATLLRPADDYVKIKLALRGSGENGGIAAPRAAAIRAAIAEHSEAGKLVDVVERGGEFELSVGFEGALQLRGPENNVRNTLRDDGSVPDVLWRHARQRALLQLRGEGGTDFVDDETLRVRLVPAPQQSPCAQGEWVQAEANTEQVVPLCHAWNVEATLAPDAPKSLLIGALVLSTDGSTFGLPRDGTSVLLQPGQSKTFDASGESFRGTPPLDTRDQVLVFGTQERDPVQWNLLTQTAATRGPMPRGLAGALSRYLQPGTRGTAPIEEDAEPTTWTKTGIGMRVEANQRFLQARGGPSSPILPREYTVKHFDIRPYLPDDSSTALAAVLRTADSLARASVVDGYGYRQHDWSGSTDEANLKVGIDCSRAIWFAFTRNELPYNRSDRYLTTSMMVNDDSWMSDQFDQCPTDEEFQLGDVLVYRSDDPQRGDGHVVMVIDPKKRISWGSHGWDGEGRTPGVQPDTGVEYQLIKYKPDWARWDRKDMSLKTCWRYRRFAQEAASGRGLPGLTSLQANACDDGVCRP